MPRMVMCVKLGRELPGLDKPPFPGELGQRIYENVSKQAWDMWPAQSTLIINHYGLNMADPEARKILREQMEEFFFGEQPKMPEGWVPEDEDQGVGVGPSAKGGGGTGPQEMRAPGDILLLSCYELGHQPLHLATLVALLRRAGYTPTAIDTAIEAPADEAIARARFVAIAVPMHTALRLGELLARRVRSLNPAAHICFYGLYAALNEDFLLQDLVDAAIGGEYEQPLLELIAALETSPLAPRIYSGSQHALWYEQAQNRAPAA